MRAGQASQVRLVDNGPLPRNHRRPVVAPIEAVVHDDALWHRARTVAAVERQIAAVTADTVTEQSIRPDQFARQFACIGIEQQLIRIETMAGARLVRAMRAVAVKLPRPGIREIA